jgi:hypothetical protein
MYSVVDFNIYIIILVGEGLSGSLNKSYKERFEFLKS